MLKKKERLSRTEFSRFFSLGKRYNSNIAQLIYTPHPTKHVSAVVSKKIERKAVDRNKLRRRVYNITRNEVDKGVYIFILKKTASETSYKNLKEEIINLISKTTK